MRLFSSSILSLLLFPTFCHAENYVLLSNSETNPIPMRKVTVDLDSVEQVGSRIAFRVSWTNPYIDARETESHVVDCTFRSGAIRLGNEDIAGIQLNRFWGPVDDKASALVCGGGAAILVPQEISPAVIPLKHYSLGAQSDKTMVDALIPAARERDAYALTNVRHAARLGNLQAQLALARIYEDYRPVHNEVEASKWYRIAAPEVIKRARSGDAAAQFELAQYHLKGIALRINREEGVKWLEKAIAQNHAPAMTELAELYRMGPHNGDSPIPLDIAKSNEWLLKAAQLGDGKAMYLLGQAYATGNGIERDAQAALSWRIKSAEAGYVNGQYFLGSAYHYGVGMPPDFALALKWLKQAALQQSGQAQSLLGTMYLYGIGVLQDDREAFTWTKKATESGESVPAAFRNLEMMLRQGRGTQQDIAEANKLLAHIDGQTTGHSSAFGFPQPASVSPFSASVLALARSQMKAPFIQHAGILKEERLALAYRCSQVDDKFQDIFTPKQVEWEQQQVESLAMMDIIPTTQTLVQSGSSASTGVGKLPLKDLVNIASAMKEATNGSKGKTLPPLDPPALEKAQQAAKAKADASLQNKTIEEQKVYCRSQLIEPQLKELGQR